MKVVPFRVTPGMGKYVCGEQLRITNLQQLEGRGDRPHWNVGRKRNLRAGRTAGGESWGESGLDRMKKEENEEVPILVTVQVEQKRFFFLPMLLLLLLVFYCWNIWRLMKQPRRYIPASHLS